MSHINQKEWETRSVHECSLTRILLYITGNLTARISNIIVTHQVHIYRCVAPIGQNSGCGRGKEMRRKGCQHCSRSLLWQLSTGGAGEGRLAAHPNERPVERIMLQKVKRRNWQLPAFICLPDSSLSSYLLSTNFPPPIRQYTFKIQSIRLSSHPHLYASSYPVLNLSRAKHSSHMQMFHLQTMNLISHYHCSLMGVIR